MKVNLATIDIVKIASATPVLSPKRRALNELFLASYHLSSYGGCEFGCPYCDGWARSETPLNTEIQVFPDHPNRLAKELVTIPPHEVLGLTHGEPYQPIEHRYRTTRHLLQVIADYHLRKGY